MKNRIYLKVFAIIVIVTIQISCKKLLEVDPPKDSLVQESVFKSDGAATSSVTGVYSAMYSTGFANGGVRGLSSLTGLSADDLSDNSNLADVTPFFSNQLTSTNLSVKTLWFRLYTTIYSSNALIEGLTSPNGITPLLKAQLLGETYFIRAFAYFYLVNLYGPVPIYTKTDYTVNLTSSRSTTSAVYNQIISDLKLAESLLNDSYPSPDRVRPNVAASRALMARVYLYNQDWANAESYATMVISNTTNYSLETIERTFLSSSKEAIWQLLPGPNSNTFEGTTFIINSLPVIYLSLRSDFVENSFEAGDKRRTSWVGTFGTYYFPYKYKVKSSTTVTEYSMVLRLAEQYLIRAEARVNLGKIDIGIGDLNIVRTRARAIPTLAVPNPLPNLSTSLNKSDALLAVEKERRNELFTEWGHRWLDLKRTGRASMVLTPKKPNWQDTDVLYPISQDEIDRNLNITQNTGYN